MPITDNLEKELRKLAAWNKANSVQGYDPLHVRKDRFGSFMQWQDYGKTTAYGWEIDHLVPSSWGGLLEPINESATHWSNNRTKSNLFAG